MVEKSTLSRAMSKHFKDDTCSHEINKRRILILQYNIKHSIFTLKIGHLKVLATFGIFLATFVTLLHAQSFLKRGLVYKEINLVYCQKNCWMSGKQCSPWLDAPFFGIWSWSTLFVPSESCLWYSICGLIKMSLFLVIKNTCVTLLD